MVIGFNVDVIVGIAPNDFAVGFDTLALLGGHCRQNVGIDLVGIGRAVQFEVFFKAYAGLCG